jgi:hypothetical protein
LCTFHPVYNDLCRDRCFRLVCDPFSGNECWDIYKFDTNERVGVLLARRSVQHLVFVCYRVHYVHVICLMYNIF